MFRGSSRNTAVAAPIGGKSMRVALVALCAFLIASPLAAQRPPLRDGALAAINKSPRHGEWVSVESAGTPPLKTWVTFPERSDKAPVIIVLSDTNVMNDWVRAIVDQFAADGLIALAPELVNVPSPAIAARVNAVHTYARSIPAADGRAAVLILDSGVRVMPPELGQDLKIPVLRLYDADGTGEVLHESWPQLLAFLKQNVR